MGILNFFKIKEENEKVDTNEINKEITELKENVEDMKQESEKISTKILPEIKEAPKEEKWIWVEGYKGTDKDMCCQPGNIDSKMQYEIDKEFTCYGDIIYGQNGFHFCEDLKDIFDYYLIDLNNRFFKVKGLVKEKDYNNMIKNKGKRSFGSWIHTFYILNSQLVAKKIIFLEEITYNNGLKKYINEYLPYVKNEEDYCKYNDYNILCKDKFLLSMKNLGFSDLFIRIQLDSMPNKAIFKYINQAKAYKKEGISKDLMIYLLEQYKDKYRKDVDN